MFSKREVHKASIVYRVHVRTLAGAEMVDYVMLTEQGNDVDCAKQVTFFRKRGRVCLQSQGGEHLGPWGTGEVGHFTVTLLTAGNN